MKVIINPTASKSYYNDKIIKGKCLMQWLVREERSVRQLLLSQRPQSLSVHPVTFLQLIHTLHPQNWPRTWTFDCWPLLPATAHGQAVLLLCQPSWGDICPVLKRWGGWHHSKRGEMQSDSDIKCKLLFYCRYFFVSIIILKAALG